MLRAFPEGSASVVAAQNRVLQALDPDVIAFQEIPVDTTEAQVQARLAATLGGTWAVNLGNTDGFIRNGLATRWSLSMERDDTTPASEVRGVTMGLVDVPDAFAARDIYFMVVHLKASSGDENEARRQQASDAMARWIGDARTPGGFIDLPASTPIVALGDFNYRDDSPGYLTVRDGDILDNATYGPDIAPDWDGTSLRDAFPPDPANWRFNTYSSRSTPSIRFDRILFTDSTIELANTFVLNTSSMTSSARSAAGLGSSDTSTASDHLPIVADFAITPTRPAVSHRELFITEIMADPSGTDSQREWLEVYNRSDAPVDLRGFTLRDQSGSRHTFGGASPLLVPARSHFVLGLNANTSTNGNVPVAATYADVFLSNSASDTVELYRGGVKIDGASFNNGPVGQDPPNVDWGGGPQASGASRVMTGAYLLGPTDTFATSTTPYSPSDRGTPGALNDLAGVPGTAWLFVE
jgi:endonuclease/exonuclease/phosphatase family metal-dependent hydrolase